MTFHYKIDNTRKYVVSTAVGPLNPSEVNEHRNQLSADPEFNPTFAHLVDLSAVTDLQITPERVQALARTPIFGPTSKTAFVVQEDLVYGMSRIFRAWRDNDQYMNVFRSLDDALRWLEIERGEDKDQKSTTR